MKTQVIYQENNGIANIQLNSASPNNKLNHDNAKELIEAFKMAEKTGCKVVVLEGSGSVFCGGGTIGNFRTMSGPQINDFAQLLQTLIFTMKQLSIPIIGAVGGDAHGGGFSLMEACDIVIASEEATFAIPEIKGGFCPAVALVSVAHSIGTAQAYHMAMTGESIDANKALELGLVQKVVKKEALNKTAQQEADQVLSGNPTAYRVTKEIAFQLSESDLRNKFSIASGKLVEFLTSYDAKEVVNATEENREKVFKKQ